MYYARLCFIPCHLSPFFIVVLWAALRKLEAKRRNVEGKLEQLGIVRKYTDSQTYPPRSRRDTFTNRKTHNNELKSHYLDTYEGLNLKSG